MVPTYKQKLLHKKGFTLLETLVAVFILTLALTGPIYIATLAIRSSVESRDNVLTDTVDANWVNTVTGGTDCKSAYSASVPTKCYMTRTSGGKYKFTQCAGTCPALPFNPAGSIIYGEDSVLGYGNSKFTREIYIQVAAQDGSTTNIPVREVNVVVAMKWIDHGRPRQLQITERLHNQQYRDYYIK
jgi:prepilin-type N-terminal cleavage/methylation domain-containing protein